MPADQVASANQLKQWLGRCSWRCKRRFRYRADVFDAAMRTWRTLGADRICVTGDLVNFAHPPEYAAAAGWLRQLEAFAPVSLVTGNHDGLVASGLQEQERWWGRWLAGRERTAWPTVTIQGAVAFVGLASGVPTPPFMAWGRVSADQLATLDAVLADLAERGCFRVVMVHHPPQPHAIARRAALRNADELREVLRHRGAELILHGHLHHPVRTSVPGPAGPIPVCGAGSASSWRDGGRATRGHFAMISIEELTASERRIAVTDYVFDATRGEFVPGSADIIPLRHDATQPKRGGA